MRIYQSEELTPTDNRTADRKWLVNKTKEVKSCKDMEFGFFSYLNYRTLFKFTTFNLN
jgi:hypothetical protein